MLTTINLTVDYNVYCTSIQNTYNMFTKRFQTLSIYLIDARLLKRLR